MNVRSVLQSPDPVNLESGEVVRVEVKPWYTSTTIWVQIASFVVTVLEATEFINVIPASWETYVLLIVFVVNVAVRIFLTGSPLSIPR